MVNPNQKEQSNDETVIPRISLRRKTQTNGYYSLLKSPKLEYDFKTTPVVDPAKSLFKTSNSKQVTKSILKKELEKSDDENEPENLSISYNETLMNLSPQSQNMPETYLIDRYKYAVRHIKQGLSVEEACNKYRISKGALLKCLSGGTAPRGKKTRLTESEENEIVEWLINYKDLRYNDAIHLVFEQVALKFEQSDRPNPFHNGKPSMDWWYDFLSRHPQIMASKPDWIMRGKVNDQYIKDVQSGHLKCTKFRRALLSAIQYIRSLNETINSSITENTNSSSNNSTMQSKNKIMSPQQKSRSCKRNLSKSSVTKFENKRKIRQPVKNNQNNCDYLNNSKVSKSCMNNTENEEMNFNDDEENLDHEPTEEENNETNIDNVTFITEIFNSELDNQNFENLIDPSLIIEKNQTKDPKDHTDENSYLCTSPIYDINPDHPFSSDFMINTDFDIPKESNSSLNSSTGMLFGNSSLLASFQAKSNFDQMYSNQRQHQHLLVPDDDENE